MIARFAAVLRRMRRSISRTEWSVRLLRLSRSPRPATEHGLVLIQIDGLARRQLERALDRGRMPFLKRLIRREGYHLHSCYSGIPSTTPAVQGELMYGLPCAVPAFNFRYSKTGKTVAMYHSDAAMAVEEGLARKGEGLLQEGSSYCNIYSGGAAETHFCAVTLAPHRPVWPVNPLTVTGMALLHITSLLKIVLLLFVEIGLAFHDLLYRVTPLRELWQELKFVPKRLAVSVLLRELVTIGAEMDTSRGLPIIHVNFLSYDEHAHRRGPSSAFAHWSLRGIDHSIRRIWHAAHRSAHRHYDVWIFADHGQEAAIPFYCKTGKWIEEAVAEVCGGMVRSDVERVGRHHHGVRAQWLRRPPSERAQQATETEGPNGTDEREPVVTALGPIGHIYLPEPVAEEQQDRLARDLVEKAGIPMVLARAGPSGASVWTASGRFVLPDEAARVLGPDHPFLGSVANDLALVCQHADSGDFVIIGWKPGEQTVTFAYENGSHGGPGSDETSGFLLVPPEAPLHLPDRRGYLRPLDVREAVLRLLGRYPIAPHRWRRAPRDRADALRIMTYNVHSCIGMDGKLAPARIARVIARYNPDIVALQELDVGRQRTGGIDQAHAIAHELEMEFHFHPSLEVEEERYGNAVLSRFPMRLVQAGVLPRRTGRRLLEPRGAIWVAVQVGTHTVHILNTHLSLSAEERLIQTEALLGPQWLAHPDCTSPVIVCGDFNARPASLVHRRLHAVLRDSQLALDDHRPRSTWIGRYPIRRLDYIFVGPEIAVAHVVVPRTELTLLASDHLPLIVDLVLPAGELAS